MLQERKESGKRGRKPGRKAAGPEKVDMKAKLERSRQSARECRARKKLRYYQNLSRPDFLMYD